MPGEEVIEQEQQEQQQDQANAEMDARAREMGWRPKDEYRGAGEKWVDSKTFVERGEHVLPLIKASADRLRQENLVLHTQLREAVEQGNKTVAALERYHQDDLKQKVAAAKDKLKTELVAAKKSGDVEAEVDLTDQLTSLNASEAAATGDDDTVVGGNADNGKKVDTTDYTKDPVYIKWTQDNPGLMEDPAKAAIAFTVSAQLRARGETRTGRVYLDLITDGVNKELTRLGVRPAVGTRKVEASRGGASGASNGSGKSYADLPPDAKSACASYVQDLVGPNKRYKTEAEWQKSYTEQYFKDI